MTRLAPCALLPLLLAGCGPSVTVAPTTSATPAPAVGPTIIVVVATPTASAPGVSPPTSNLTADEQSYVIAAGRTITGLGDIEKMLKNGGMSRIVDARAQLQQIKVDYEPITVPTSFTKADFYLRRALGEQDVAYTIMDAAKQMNSTEMFDKAEPHFMDAYEYTMRAATEIRRITK